MCAIAGVLSDHPNIDLVNIMNMNNTLIHRGPDGYGYLCTNSVLNQTCTNQVQVISYGDFSFALAHRRLAIHDLSPAGHQPMSYLQRYWIVFNGEIYNFIELKAELEAKGYAFLSHTDTEVIMAAYDCWGTECLKKFNGMWAFVLIDTFENKIFISRDRFGVKPLYYCIGDGFFAFASEIKGLLAYPGVTKEPNLMWIKTYLEDEPKEHIKETAFKDIFRFDFSSYFEGSISELIRFDSHAIKKFWIGNPNSSNEFFDKKKLDEYASQYSELLEDAVKLRLRSDVKVGSALSGGLDSSTIVSLVNKLHKEQGISDKQETFSSVYKTPGTESCDESIFINEVADVLQVKSNQIEPIVSDIPTEHRKMIYHLETPPENTLMSSWYTFKLVGASDITVTLDGQGADEQLAGYLGYYLSDFSLASFKEIISGFSEFRKVPGVMKHFCVGVLANVMSRLIGKKAVIYLYKKIGRQEPLFQPLNERLFENFSTSLVTLLHYADSTSMAFSIESRMPFMDYRLVDFLLSVPACYKLHQGWTKYLARVASEILLPSSIAWRKDKKGWPIPEKFWFENSHKKWFENELEESQFFKSYPEMKNQKKWQMLSLKNKIKWLNISIWYSVFFVKDLHEIKEA